MKNTEKIITLTFITLTLFLISLLLFNNDIINYFIFFISLSGIFFIYLIYIVFHKDDEIHKYKKKLNDILNTYDSILIYSKNDIDFMSENIIFVKSFQDIYIVHLIVKKMIIYINQEYTNLFLLLDGNILYVYSMKYNENICNDYEEKLRDRISNKLFLVNNN